jgi:hypothetical protein
VDLRDSPGYFERWRRSPPGGASVTEAEWLDAKYPLVLLYNAGGLISDRKLRLFACACCRRIPGLPEVVLPALLVLERHADGLLGQAEIQAALAPVEAAAEARHYDDRAYTTVTYASLTRAQLGDDASMHHYVGSVAATTARSAAVRRRCSVPGITRSDAEAIRHAESVSQCQIAQDILRNPFRPAPAVDPAWLAWQGGTVAKLARAAYEERRLPEGTLDPARLAVLADALEEAGCGDAELLGHLRGPGVHCRGCWPVDLILGMG